MIIVHTNNIAVTPLMW